MERYQKLLSLYLDGKPTQAELAELADLLKSDEKLAEDFRQELLIWEAWSQEMAPERKADAFLAGFHTRLRAEEDAADFELSVTKQLKERKNPFILQPLIAIAAVLVILLSFGYFFNPADLNTGIVATADAGQVHIRGECICMRCTLRQSGGCSQAVRYSDKNGEVQLIRLKHSECLKEYKRSFCKGPTVAIIKGEFIEENGEKLLLANSISIGDENVL